MLRTCSVAVFAWACLNAGSILSACLPAGDPDVISFARNHIWAGGPERQTPVFTFVRAEVGACARDHIYYDMPYYDII